MKKRMRARNQHLKRLLSLLLTVVMVFAMIPAAFAADTASGFVIGPYLLAPKTTSMVAVWETSGSEPTTIRLAPMPTRWAMWSRSSVTRKHRPTAVYRPISTGISSPN